MSKNDANMQKRRFLLAATGVAGGVATAFAAVPFVESMLPSEAAKAAGAPVDADIGKLEPGQKMTVQWRGQPVWILRRTQKMLEAVRADDNRVSDPHSESSQQPAYCKNEYRALKPEYFIAIGICTHLGCSPVDRFKAEPEPFASDWLGGFYCPCHGSVYDLAGRVYKNKPAPLNLVIPPYKFVTETKVVIGDDKKTDKT